MNGFEEEIIFSFIFLKKIPYLTFFLANKNIRSVKKYEGDTVLESRFGQSIRFSAYDSNRNNDTGAKEYKDYYNEIIINGLIN